LDALEKRIVQQWEGIAWRVTVGGAEPLRANIRGARWNPRDVEALYASLDRAAAIAETEHLLSLQPIRVAAPRMVSKLSVRLSRLVDLSGAEPIHSLGLKVEDLTGEDWTLPQRIGSAVEFLQIPALLVPSARAKAVNLVLLMKNQSIGDSVQLVETLPAAEDA
jgi:RES domain-containing protein